MEIGSRIAIYGPTGAGKSALGSVLGQRLRVPVVELDTIFWLPNWTSKPEGQFRADVLAAVEACSNGWVVVGNYSRVQDLILSQADTVIWLRLPFRITFWRLFKRTVSRAFTHKPLWNSNPNRESWRQSFLSKDSILLYAITSRKTHVENVQRILRETPHHAQVLEMYSPRDVREFMGEMPPR